VERRHQDAAVDRVQVHVLVELGVVSGRRLAAAARYPGCEAVLGPRPDLDDRPWRPVLVDHGLDAARVLGTQGDHPGEVLLGEDVFEGRPRGGQREGVAGERAADAALVDEVGLGVGEDALGEVLGDAVGADRDARAERLADGHHVGAQAPGTGAAAVAGAERVGLIVDEQGPSLVAEGAHGVQEPRLRRDDADVGHGRFHEDGGDVAGGERLAQGVDVVELDDLGGQRRVDLGPHVARLGHRPAVGTDDDDGLVDRAVVAAREDEDVRASRDLARHAQHEPVRVSGGERELPVGEAEATLQVAADRGGIFRREHRRDAAVLADALAHGLHDDLRRVAGHRPGVAKAEVDVGASVDVGDAVPVRLREVHWEAAWPDRHPAHRDPGEQAAPRVIVEFERTWVTGDVRAALAFQQRAEAPAVERAERAAVGGAGRSRGGCFVMRGHGVEPRGDGAGPRVDGAKVGEAHAGHVVPPSL